MKTEDIKKMAQAWLQVQEASKMDPVDPKELKGKHKDRKDKDINNDGKVDSTDKYLHARRKAVSAAIKGKKKDQEVEVQTSESKVEEGSIKGSGTDRKAQLKKAYRDGEQKTRDFYKGTITPAPKTKDKGIKKAFDKGTGSNDGSPAPRGIDRTTARDRLKNTEHGRSEPHIDVFGNKGKTHYKTQTHASKMNAIRYAKKGKLPEATDYLGEGINIGKLHDLHAYHEKKAEAHAAAQKKHDSNSKMADHHSEQGYEHENAADHLHNASKAYDKGDHKAVAKHLDMYHKTPVARQGIKEAANHGNMNNGSPAGEGLSPSAKKELARKTPMPDFVNEPKVDKKTFDAIRASAKKAPARNGDNTGGDKNVINKPMDITAKAPKKEDDGFKDS